MAIDKIWQSNIISANKDCNNLVVCKISFSNYSKEERKVYEAECQKAPAISGLCFGRTQ